VWDFSITSLPRTLRALAAGRLALPSGEGPPDDDVEATDLFTYQLLPGFFGVDDYRPVVELFTKIVGDSRQFMTFPYDWRASNRHAAQRLEGRALETLHAWRKHSGRDDAKLWLVCHSMGGLVARYFCEHLGGAEHTRAIVTFGTPHRGAVKALDALANGKRIGPLDLSALVRSFPSAYELLPLYPAVRIPSQSGVVMHRIADFFGLDPVTGADTAAPATLPPITGLDREQLKRALEFHSHIRVPAEARAERGEPCSYRQEAFFNRRQLTSVSAALVDGALQILDTYPYERGGRIADEADRGDGTVPSFSSVPIEWNDTAAAVAVAEKHAAMQCDLAVRDTVLNWMRPLDVRAKKGAAVDERLVAALTVPPVLDVGQPLRVQVSALRPMNVQVRVQHVETGRTQTLPLMVPGDDVQRDAIFKGLEIGVHRVAAVPVDGMLPTISDYVYVDEQASA
jgi:pimeloyl-ACP methyl ester carboxylesterase